MIPLPIVFTPMMVLLIKFTDYLSAGDRTLTGEGEFAVADSEER